MVKLVANPLIQRFRQSLEGVEDVEVTLAGAEDVGVAKVVRPEAMANSSSTVKCAKMGQASLGKAGDQGTAITHNHMLQKSLEVWWASILLLGQTGLSMA